MPSFHAYGIHAYLELRGLHSNSSPKTAPRVTESPPVLKWSPMQGMTHPISITTVFSPVKSASHSPVPFCIVVEFSPDSPCLANRQTLPSSNHLKGDVRIEVKIDGVVRGWKILPQAKIWPKGVRIEFSGSRVGRTEEKAFVFNPLPSDSGTDNHRARTPSTFTPTFPVHVTGLPSVWDSGDPTLIPFAPSDLPPNASHIEILITLGKKHNTLEKYLIFSPVLQEAFYIPPRLAYSPLERPEGSVSADNKGMKRKAEPSPRSKAKVVKAATLLAPSYQPPTTANEEQLKEAEGQNVYAEVDTEIKTIEWRSVGLAGKSQKTAQMREAEFTARIHLARFWFIIAPEPPYLVSQSQIPISSTPLASFDGQQDTKSDNILDYNGGQVQQKTRDSLEKHSHTKLESSNPVARRVKRKTSMRNAGIGEFLPGSPQAQEVGSIVRKQVPGTQNIHLIPGITAGVQYQEGSNPTPKTYPDPGSEHNGRASRKLPQTTPPHMIDASTGFIKPVGERMNPRNIDRTTNILKINSDSRGNQANDTPASEMDKMME